MEWVSKVTSVRPRKGFVSHTHERPSNAGQSKRFRKGIGNRQCNAKIRPPMHGGRGSSVRTV